MISRTKRKKATFFKVASMRSFEGALTLVGPCQVDELEDKSPL